MPRASGWTSSLSHRSGSCGRSAGSSPGRRRRCPINRQDIHILYRYNQWANARILGAATGLTAEEFRAPAAFPHGGLRGTLVHALFAEWIWRQRWEGRSPSQGFRAEDFPTIESLEVRWQDEERQLMQFVETLTDERLSESFSYRNTSGQEFTRVLWHAMAHVVNHGTQHRSEAAAILTDLGRSPGDLDMIYFLNDL